MLQDKKLVKDLKMKVYGYAVISAFEVSFRKFLARHLEVMFATFRDGVPEGVLKKAAQRSKSESWSSPLEFLEHTDFPDLKEIMCSGDQFIEHFKLTSIAKKDFQKFCDELYQLRCRIDHVRDTFTALDFERLTNLATRVASAFKDEGVGFSRYVRELSDSPEHFFQDVLPRYMETVHVPTNVPHNLPWPDYDSDGGFVGRDDDIKTITNYLLSNRPVITISGAGGVGKTALALNVLYQLLERTDVPFDGIVWMSAKENELTELGIKDLEPTVRSYEELLDKIYEVIGFKDPAESIECKEDDLNVILDSAKCLLIVIDNLETITDRRIKDFILDPHPNVKIFITSRRGLGEVERRHELKELKEKEAIRLFRRIATQKKLNSLSSLSDEKIKLLVKRVSFYPLAIKWVIGRVSLGKNIGSVINSIDEKSSDISNFCFDQIFSELNEPARKVLCALSCMDTPPAAGVLNYVVGLENEVFEDSIQDLILVSLVVPDADETQVRYSLLPLTRGYVRRRLNDFPSLKKKIQEQLQEVKNRLEEAERLKKHFPSSNLNLGATSQEELVAATIILNANQQYKAGSYEDAGKLFTQAQNIAPNFPSVYRHWAIMEAQERHYRDADHLMEKASRLNPTDAYIWLNWGILKKRENQIPVAREYVSRAHQLAPSDHSIVHELGVINMRAGDHADADRFFRDLIKDPSFGSSRKDEIFYLTSFARNLKRWAEILKLDRKYQEAEEKLNEAFAMCEKLIELDPSDKMAESAYRSVLCDLGYLYKHLKNDEISFKYFFRLSEATPDLTNVRDTKQIAQALLFVGNYYLKKGQQNRTKDLLEVRLKPLVKTLSNYNQISLVEGINRLSSLARLDKKPGTGVAETSNRPPEVPRDRPKNHRPNDKWVERKVANRPDLSAKAVESHVPTSIPKALESKIARDTGSIERIEFDRKFAIVKSATTGETYLAHYRDFENGLDDLSKCVKGTMIEFAPSRHRRGTNKRLIATSIQIR